MALTSDARVHAIVAAQPNRHVEAVLAVVDPRLHTESALLGMRSAVKDERPPDVNKYSRTTSRP